MLLLSRREIVERAEYLISHCFIEAMRFDHLRKARLFSCPNRPTTRSWKLRSLSLA
jgi:hypothetical protein